MWTLSHRAKAGKGSGNAPSTAATDVWLNSGPGHRLDGGANDDLKTVIAMSTSDRQSGNGGNGDEDDLAIAIALSLQSASPGGNILCRLGLSSPHNAILSVVGSKASFARHMD